MYRVALETILGIELRGDQLRITPRIPAAWPEYTVTLRRRETTWRIRVINIGQPHDRSGESSSVGEVAQAHEFELDADGGDHEINLKIFSANIAGNSTDSSTTEVAASRSNSGATRISHRVGSE
jgi:trehalose/maltose hydrolase-like predicted phosphorylase